MKTHVLPVQTNQVLQETHLANESEAWLLFEDNIQLWNLDSATRLFQGKANPSVFYYTLPTAINKTTLAVVRLENNDPQLETYNVETNNVQALGGFPNSRENYSKLFHFGEVNKIVVVARGDKHRLYLWDGNKDKGFVKELPFK